MSAWTHSICDPCWQKMNPERTPVRSIPAMESPTPGRCCYCGEFHNSGIYIRANPADMECNGDHEGYSTGTPRQG